MGKVDKFLDTSQPLFLGESIEPNENRKIRGERVNLSFPIYATFNGSLIQGFVQAVNLSWSGMLLETNFPLNTGDKLKLEFTLPEMHVPISVNARVVRKSDERIPEEATLIGVVFEEVEPNVQRMISGYVLENL